MRGAAWLFGAALVTAGGATGSAADPCRPWPGEPTPLATVQDADPVRARWAALRVREITALARRAEARGRGLAHPLWTHAACLDPTRDELTAAATRTQPVRLHRPELLDVRPPPEPPRADAVDEAVARLAYPVITRGMAPPPPEPLALVMPDARGEAELEATSEPPEPVTAEEPPAPSEPVVAEEPPAPSEPVAPKEATAASERVAAAETSAPSELDAAEEPPAPSEPVVAEEQPKRPAPEEASEQVIASEDAPESVAVGEARDPELGPSPEPTQAPAPVEPGTPVAIAPDATAADPGESGAPVEIAAVEPPAPTPDAPSPVPAADPESLLLAEEALRAARFQSALEHAAAARDDLGEAGSPEQRGRVEVVAGTAALALGRTEEARASFERALAADPALELDAASHAPKVRRFFDSVRQARSSTP